MGTSLLATGATKEQAVKAGLVYNITKYVVWPSAVSHGEQFNLCVFGDEQLGGALQALQGKLVAGRPLVIRRKVNSKDFESCHMAFMAKDDTGGSYSALQKLIELPVLTVSDSPDFIHHGGMVGLVRDERRVGFEVNLTAVKAVGLGMSAQLLKLAKTVKGLK